MKRLKAPPTYKEGRYGNWSIKFLNTIIRHGTSYFSGVVPLLPVTPALYDASDRLWMSVTPMELESQYPHNEAAFGHVVVMGAGMGVLPYNLLLNKAVTQVTVIEHCADLCKHWNDLTGLKQWRGHKKLLLVNADAREWKGRCDVLLADIWLTLGDDRLEEDMQTFRRNVQFHRMLCWGGELAYLSWCRRQGLYMHTAKDEHADQWSKETGHYVYKNFRTLSTCVALTAVAA
jgi:hypothetical protein